jgi:hypothetical protein
MSSEVMVCENPRPSREDRLARLAEVANREHENLLDMARHAVAHALEAGNALLEAKKLCAKGTWTAWLAERFRGDASTARGYMRLATYLPRMVGDRESIRDLNYTDAIRMIKGLKQVDGRVNNNARRRPKQAAALVGQPAMEANHPTEATPATALALPAALPGERFALFGKLLGQAISELRRLADASRSDAPYARHLLRPLERIHAAAAEGAWVWDD